MQITIAGTEGVEVSIIVLLFIGFSVGVAGGFVGVGGGFLVTPALIILGLPGQVAAGTGMAYVVGSALFAVTRHRRMGNLDAKLAGLLAVGTVFGVEVGVRLVNRAKAMGMADEAVLVGSLVVLAFVGGFTVFESLLSHRKMTAERAATGSRPREMVGLSLAKHVQRLELRPMVDLPKSGIRVSLWAILGLGVFAGVLTGFMGVGGGFVKTPALIYLLGVPSFVAVGTGLFEMVVSGGFGAVRHGMSGNVAVIPAAMMIVGAFLGARIGAVATRHASGPGVRLVLAAAICLGAAGVSLKVADMLLGGVAQLEWLAGLVVFGTMAALVLAVASITGLSALRERGVDLPDWCRNLLAPRSAGGLRSKEVSGA